MRLSALQHSILLAALGSRRTSVPRNDFKHFYDRMEDPPKAEDQQNSITKSLERLIDKGLLIGFGRRTPEKWFIDTVKLTAAGRRAAKRLLGEQQRLPLKLNKNKRP